jgi:YidC/Oxa1 family membrane protein insertase
MSKPTQKPSFIQNALLMITIFMGIQLFLGSRNEPKDTRTIDQLHQELVVDNQKLLDLTIVKTAADYSNRLDDLVAKKVLSKAVADADKIEASILVADTQFKAGLYRDDTGRIRNAYQVLLPYQKKLLDKPEWNKQVSIPKALVYGPYAPEGGVVQSSIYHYSWSSWTGQDFFQEIVKTLSSRNRTEYVYGVIPGYGLMDALVHMTGAVSGFSYAFAAFLLALIVRASVFPLSQKQLMFSRQMSQLVPLTNEIKQKYKNDPNKQQAEIMGLYREYGINPLAGCFPMFIQMPLFLTVYQCMLKYQFAFQSGTFLWINPATSKATNGFVGPNLGQQDYILIFIYGITMVIATLLTPVSDPSQAKQQRYMGVGISLIFTFFMFTGAFPVVSGFVLYWTFTNILATAQSLRAYRMPMPPLVKVNAAGGGVLPKPTSKWQQMMDKVMEEQQRQQATNGDVKRPSPDDLNNGKDKNGSPKANVVISSDNGKTGTPAKHKPKKRK